MLRDRSKISQRFGYGVRVSSVDIVAYYLAPSFRAEEAGESKIGPLGGSGAGKSCHVCGCSFGLGRGGCSLRVPGLSLTTTILRIPNHSPEEERGGQRSPTFP